ncbi:MAG: ABC transporter permease [Clostridiales bacterium]|nr:ABC transporter permease [Clostridiales bacterium]
MLEIIKEHIGFRKQILSLAKADIVKTYKGSALGWLWAIIKPITTIFVYWFAFRIGLRASRFVDGNPFFVWLIAGIVPWFYISEMITQGTGAIRKYRYLVTKMKFPVSTVPTFVSLSKLLVHMGLLLITIVILITQGYPIDIYYLQLPYYMLMMFIFFVMWSLFSSPLAAISKDFSNLVKSLLTAIFWFSGILYDPRKIKIKLLRRILMLNPVTYIVQGYRDTLIFKVWFWENKFQLISFLIILSLMTFIAIKTYKKLRKDIPDVL